MTLGIGGTVLSQGSPADIELQISEIDDQDRKKLIDENADADVNRGKLIMPEDIQEGHVGWKAFRIFLDSLGGKRPVLFWVIFIGGMFSFHFLNTAQTW